MLQFFVSLTATMAENSRLTARRSFTCLTVIESHNVSIDYRVAIFCLEVRFEDKETVERALCSSRLAKPDIDIVNASTGNVIKKDSARWQHSDR